MMPVFHGISRAEGPFKQTTEGDGLCHAFFAQRFPRGQARRPVLLVTQRSHGMDA
jgi:hypothetical protein